MNKLPLAKPVHIADQLHPQDKAVKRTDPPIALTSMRASPATSIGHASTNYNTTKVNTDTSVPRGSSKGNL